jgi:hypothetical protein
MEMMNVKDYQKLAVDEPLDRKIGEMFRPKIDYGRMERGKLVPVYKIINITKNSYEFVPKQVRLI